MTSITPPAGPYEAGTIVQCSVSFLNGLGQLADPTNVSFAWQPPGAGALQTGVGIKDSVGQYHFDLDTTGAAGFWTWEFKGTGVVQAVTVGQFVVTPVLY